jgi:hypothetical protein
MFSFLYNFIFKLTIKIPLPGKREINYSKIGSSKSTVSSGSFPPRTTGFIVQKFITEPPQPVMVT